MTIAVLGIDLAKHVFQLHGVDAHGRTIVSKRVGRAKLAEAVVQLAPRVVALEACCGAHYWGRRFRDLGLEVRLIHARFVRPYVKSAKNDARDAEAICEAALRPHMRFVPIKSPEQLDIQALHRVREQLVRWRTALINQIRGLLAEHGIVLPQGAWRLRPGVVSVLDDPASELTTLAAELFRGLLDQLRGLEARIATLDHRIVQLCRASETCRRLAALPRASARSSPRPWWRASATRASSAAAGTLRPGSAWCRGSTRAVGGRSSWASVPAAIITSASSSSKARDPCCPTLAAKMTGGAAGSGVCSIGADPTAPWSRWPTRRRESPGC
jgi:transposase